MRQRSAGAALERLAAELRERERGELRDIQGQPERFMPEADAQAYWSGRMQAPQHDGEFLTSDQMARRLGLKTRQSVLDRMRAGRLVGWQGERRGYVFPAEQVASGSRLTQGLEQIRERFDTGEAAWWWLTTPCPGLNGKRPMDCLRQGQVDDVVFALEGYLQGTFG